MTINGVKTNLENDAKLEKSLFEMACFFAKRENPKYSTRNEVENES